MAQYEPCEFLRAESQTQLRLSFCNHASIGQFECARGVMFRLFDEDRDGALELLEVLIRREQPREWLCSRTVPSTAHLAWLCLTLRHELLSQCANTKTDTREEEPTRDAGTPSTLPAPPSLHFPPVSRCSTDALEFDVLLANCLLQSDQNRILGQPELTAVACQQLRYAVFSACVTSKPCVGADGIPLANTTEVHLPVLAFHKDPRANISGTLPDLPAETKPIATASQVVGDHRRNLGPQLRDQYTDSRRPPFSFLSKDVMTFLGRLLRNVTVVSDVPEMVSEFALALSRLGATDDLTQLLELCAAVAASDWRRGCNRRAGNASSDTRALAVLRLLTDVFDASVGRTVGATSSSSSSDLSLVSPVVVLLLRALVHLVRSRPVKRVSVDHQQKQSWQRHAGLVSVDSSVERRHHKCAATAFAKLAKAVAFGSSMPRDDEIRSSQKQSSGLLSTALRNKIYEVLLGSSNFLLLRAYRSVGWLVL